MIIHPTTHPSTACRQPTVLKERRVAMAARLGAGSGAGCLQKHKCDMRGKRKVKPVGVEGREARECKPVAVLFSIRYRKPMAVSQLT